MLSKELIEQFMQVNASDDKRDDITDITRSISIGIVVNADDPLEDGRLMIFCPDFNDSVKKIHHLPWAAYSSPFAGSINNQCYARGHIAGQESTSGAVHYGFWGIPEQGAHVLVACINGDIRRRVWLGCLPQRQETHTLFNGRFKWEGGNVDGPLSSGDSPIEPAYTNASKAFEDDRKSAEWKTRGAEYQAAAVREDIGEIPTPSKSTYLDNQYPEISEAEEDDWVKPILGSHGYDWTGHKQLGEFKSSRVYGMSTPGFHSFMMDDRAFNSRMRFKTAAGNQIILDDTNERIYVSSAEGNSYIEMDGSGNVEVYSKRRLSVHSEKDINLESDETVRIKGRKGIHMYAGNTTGQSPLESIPADGQIRLHSTDDMHLFSENNLRVLVENDALFEVGNNYCTSVGSNYSLQVENNIDIITNDGNMSTSVTGDILINASVNISQFSGNQTKHQAVNDMEVFAFRGKMDIGAQMELTISSKGENVGIESETKAVNISASEETSLATFDENGIVIVSDNQVTTASNTDYVITVSDDITASSFKDETPGCINFPGVNVNFGGNLVDFDVLNDVTFRLPNSVAETVSSINDKFTDIESKWNQHMQTALQFMNSTLAAITSLDPGDLTIPALVGFPVPPPVFTFELPAIDFPNLTLPELCLDLSNILDVDDFNLVPETLFQLNVDLGGWTTDSLKGWVDGLSSEVDKLKRSFDFATDLNILQSEIDDIISEFENINVSLENLVDINITGNTAEYQQYISYVDSLTTAVETYDVQIQINGGSSVISMTSNLQSQNDNSNTINDTFGGGTPIDGYDFSALQSSVDTMSGYIDDLGGGI